MRPCTELVANHASRRRVPYSQQRSAWFSHLESKGSLFGIRGSGGVRLELRNVFAPKAPRTLDSAYVPYGGAICGTFPTAGIKLETADLDLTYSMICIGKIRGPALKGERKTSKQSRRWILELDCVYFSIRN